MRQFGKIVKPVAFSDKDVCERETTRVITDTTFNKNYPAVGAIVIDSEEEMQKHIYPRIEYFHKHRSNKIPSIKKTNRFKNENKLFSNKQLPIFDTTNKQATYNTIDYVLDQFQKCLFVQIMNNKIYTFAVINRYDPKFSLSWAKKFNNLLDRSKYKSLAAFIDDTQNRLFKHYQIMKRQEDTIYFTDCKLHLWDSDMSRSKLSYDRIYGYFYHLLLELLAKRKIADCEFLFNTRDQNMLLQDGESSPHYNILGSFTSPLAKKYKPFIPILNFNKHRRFADTPVPTNDDWEILTNKMFIGECRSLYLDIQKHLNRDYDSKIPTAIFRGGATGCGTTIKNNPRLKAAYLTSKYYKHPKYGIANKDGPYLDARIVSFKQSAKKHYSDKYISTVDPSSLPIRTSKKMPLAQMSNYKYILSIEGNIAQFRLTLELSYNSVILLVRSDQYIWYQPLLKPWVHYVPVKADLSDLIEKIDWCRSHDAKCKTIAANAYKFYQKYISRESVYDYMECVFNK